MNLIRFTFANILDFKSVMDSIKRDINLYESSCFHSSDMDKLIIIFTYRKSSYFIDYYINSICTPTNIEDLHE